MVTCDACGAGHRLLGAHPCTLLSLEGHVHCAVLDAGRDAAGAPLAVRGLKLDAQAVARHELQQGPQLGHSKSLARTPPGAEAEGRKRVGLGKLGLLHNAATAADAYIQLEGARCAAASGYRSEQQ